MIRRGLPVYVLAVAMMTGCAKKVQAPVAAAPAPAPAWPVKSPNFIDLLPGWRVRQTTPILASGGFIANGQVQQEGTTINLVGSDIQGYETAVYTMTPARGGGARANLTSVETTTLSKTGDQKTAESASRVPLLGFPSTVRYIRLLYFIRVSDADHNMAVLGADGVEQLNSLTKRVQDDPATGCQNISQAYCVWVPAGVAVNPEQLDQATNQWLSAR